ncbi:ComEA family DNA-binding protein [Seongchinamella unica]|uniref:ComEA family DNA-binding protein n=1 Tax=Seongchinamella unica TaxID=2547392 RepID=UPI001EED61CD|nr:ComEA family DNA-binding protein [Seongchinamella unica]
MTKSIVSNTARGSAHRFQPVKQLATLLVLLCALVAMPLQAQESPPDPPAVAAVNINTADASALAAGLTGVGPSRAEDIVRYREAFGPFTTVEQLAEVKGVGPSTLEKNRARITLD